MDFGLDKFIEMFEERFGRKVTTALLVLIGVGIASVMVHLIWTNLIRPIYSYTKSINLFGFAAHAGGFSWSDAANFGLSLFFWVLRIECYVANRFGHFFNLEKRYRRHFQEHEI
jgi:E3 ubiquitin-protein ligase DOA10